MFKPGCASYRSKATPGKYKAWRPRNACHFLEFARNDIAMTHNNIDVVLKETKVKTIDGSAIMVTIVHPTHGKSMDISPSTPGVEVMLWDANGSKFAKHRGSQPAVIAYRGKYWVRALRTNTCYSPVPWQRVDYKIKKHLQSYIDVQDVIHNTWITDYTPTGTSRIILFEVKGAE